MTPDHLNDPAIQAKAQATRSAGSLLSTEELIEKALIGIEADQGAAIHDRALEMPENCVRTYLRAIRGRSMRAAIKAFCCECMGWEDYHRGIRDCTSPACPLFPYRPFQGETPCARNA